MKKVIAVFLCLILITGCSKSTAISKKFDPESIFSSAKFWEITMDDMQKDTDIKATGDTYQYEKKVPFINNDAKIMYSFHDDGKLGRIYYGAQNVAVEDFQNMSKEYDSIFTNTSKTLQFFDNGQEKELDWTELGKLLDKKEKSFVCNLSWEDNGTQIMAVYSYMSGNNPALIVTILRAN